MAKGNMLLGYSRGSVGSMVFSRVKGQQITKARNSSPANPKTKKQMQQRSSFISPVKFYTHCVQALFKFAFSDRKVTESDFNAFMRNNAKAAFPVTKAENDNPGFPALGNYMMTKGKLPEIPTVKLENFPNANWIELKASGKLETVGAVSSALVANGLAEEGDIITCVSIDEVVKIMSDEVLGTIPGNSPVWTINQFVVDSANSVEIGIACPAVRVERFESGAYLGMHGRDADPSTHLHAVAFIRSRETALGLEVSTSYLHNGGYIDDYIQFRNSKAQVDKVLADWGATGDAILQGSIAKK